MRIVLIDGLNLVRRVYAGVPEAFDEAAHTEQATEAVQRSVQRLLSRLRPTHAAGVFDSPPPTWRHTIHPDYKLNRPSMPAPLAAGLSKMEGAFEQCGVRCLRISGFEADDVVASIAVRIASSAVAQSDLEIIIVSTDGALLGLLGKHIAVWHHFDDRYLDEAYARERFGVAPHQLSTYFALVGDSAQGIPGVPGIGARTASALINEHGDLDALLGASLEGRSARALETHADRARLSWQLTTLKLDIEAGVNLKDMRL